MVLLLAAPVLGAAQEFLVRLDARVTGRDLPGHPEGQHPGRQVVTGPGGGPETPDGFAAICLPGRLSATSIEPAESSARRPVRHQADLTAWGLGVRGLSLHANARLGVDLGASEVWPGTDPAVQLLKHTPSTPMPTSRAGWVARPSRVAWGTTATTAGALPGGSAGPASQRPAMSASASPAATHCR